MTISNQEDDRPFAVVLPLRGSLDEPTPVDGGGWGPLSDGDGLLVSWKPVGPDDATKAWGPALQASSSFAKQLLEVSQRAGKSVATGATLFRLELPTGQTLQQLIPAVGGGFRGMTRAADGVKIAGQARLIPVSGVAVGTGLALGPLVGLMALSVGAEMLARHQQEQMLAAIQRSVEYIEKHLAQELDAKLKTAERALVAANAALLDQVTIPQAVGLSSAITGLSDVRNQTLGWLDHWEAGLAKLPSDKHEVGLDRMKAILDGGPGGAENFVQHVQLLYRSLSLDSRAAVLQGSETAFANPGQSFDNVEQQIRARLSENAAGLDRLTDTLLGLAELRVTAATLSLPGTGAEATKLGSMVVRLAHALVRQVPAAPVLGHSGRQVLEAIRYADGSVAIRSPHEAGAS